MNSHLGFISEVEKLQLPCRFDFTVETGWVEELLADYDTSAEDLALALADDVDRWREGAEVPDLVRSVIGLYLAAADVDKYSLTGESYLELFRRIQKGDKKNWRGLDWFTTKLLLSKARVIGYLQSEERYSGSQVVKVLAATDNSLTVPFQTVNIIGERFGTKVIPPAKEAINETWERSRSYGDKLFADATVQESCGKAALIANGFAPIKSLESDLLSLSGFRSDNEPSWNYLQMLYWQALILEYYDHPASWLYEFVPRGSSATYALKKFEVSTNNPFLNNAKGTASLNWQWALNRGGDDAHGLVSILTLLEELPRTANVEVARILRAWIVRTFELQREQKTNLYIIEPRSAYNRLINAVINGGTETYGVIEQRVVDALSALAFSDSTWTASGLGDHVNATNTAKKKLGDVEFASPETLQAVAIEAHGGKLTRAYVDSHNLSLSRNLKQRLLTSWASLAEASKWRVNVLFVAHTYSDENFPKELVLHQVPVTFEYLDYSDLLARAVRNSSPDDFEVCFDNWVIRILNSQNVRQAVREKARKFMGDAAVLTGSN